MDAKGYFDEVVQPMVSELKDRRDDRAFIIATAILTFHAVDWIAEERNEEKLVVRKRVSARFPDFKYLRAVANAHKHKKVDNPNEFKGLTDPLTKKELINVVKPGHPIRSEFETIVVHVPPQYSFADENIMDPLDLITGAAKAIAEEFQ